MEYIDQYRHEFGAWPICRTLTAAGTQIAPSTYYAFKTHPPSKRALRDEELLVEIHRVHAANFGAAGQTVDGGVVVLALGAFAVVVGLGDRVVVRGDPSRVEQDVRQPLVARSGRELSADRVTGSSRDRCNPGISREVARGLEREAIADVRRIRTGCRRRSRRYLFSRLPVLSSLVLASSRNHPHAEASPPGALLPARTGPISC